jgi:hypothetical protein
VGILWTRLPPFSDRRSSVYTRHQQARRFRSGPKKVVYVMSRHSDIQRKLHHDILKQCPRSRIDHRSLPHTCDNTLYWDWDRQAPTKAIFVNAGGIHHRQFLDDYGEGFRTRQSYHETEEAFQGIFNDTFGLPGPSSGDWRANSEVEKLPECSFLTMREYLTTHDWSGEFTAKEVRPWLDDGADKED